MLQISSTWLEDLFSLHHVASAATGRSTATFRRPNPTTQHPKPASPENPESCPQAHRPSGQLDCLWSTETAKPARGQVHEAVGIEGAGLRLMVQPRFCILLPGSSARRLSSTETESSVRVETSPAIVQAGIPSGSTLSPHLQCLKKIDSRSCQ